MKYTVNTFANMENADRKTLQVWMKDNGMIPNRVIEVEIDHESKMIYSKEYPDVSAGDTTIVQKTRPLVKELVF